MASGFQISGSGAQNVELLGLGHDPLGAFKLGGHLQARALAQQVGGIALLETDGVGLQFGFDVVEDALDLCR